MNKQTSELWPLQFEEDATTDRVVGAKAKETGRYPDEPLLFNPPTPQTETERKFDNCVKRGKSDVSYSIGVERISEHPVYQEFLDAKVKLYKEWFGEQSEYTQLLDMLDHPVGNTKEISELVRTLRSRLKSNQRIGNVYFEKWPYDFSNQVFPTEVNTLYDLKIHESFLMKGGYWDEEYRPLGKLENPLKIDHLYHWAPKVHVDNILQYGLLPGFVTLDSPRFQNYVFSAIQKDSEWHRTLGKKQLDNEDWVLLKIGYNSVITTAYYPLRGSYPEEVKYPDYPVHMVVRDTAIPLSDMITLQRNKDLKYIRKQAHMRKQELLESKWVWGVTGMDIYKRVDEMKKLGYGLWSYSDIHDSWIPPEMRGLDNPQFNWIPDNLSQCNTFNEVRLDYVGPEYIEVVKEESF